MLPPMERTKPCKPQFERRSATRYKLQLPVIFHWEDGEPHTDGGFTYDVSLDGVLVQSKTCPSLGAAIWVEVLLPPSGTQRLGLRIQCSGTVTRVLNNSGAMAFGVEGDFDAAHLSSGV
jgi:hypothetical protein